MARVYVGIGSNIDPERNITAAVKMLKARVRVIAVSTFYQTPAVGNSNSPDFINGAALIETDIPAHALKFEALRGIEKSLGRLRTENKYSPRTIDLDIMIYGDAVIDEPELIIPDPDIYTRAFAAAAIAEMDPNLVLPESGDRILDIARSLVSNLMRPLVDFTAALRKEIGT
ncbi:MAG: 2-amino-4-hydroxy-6-hydroxymethyldihydropteridine diphosphokinase [Armatimonadetes bacterium]|nr:2-amino-4-hydroxy-6-hydroxymethyldihydropteridine diphosphokinase [Armatimonadota bacterium]